MLGSAEVVNQGLPVFLLSLIYLLIFNYKTSYADGRKEKKDSYVTNGVLSGRVFWEECH